ncbi:unnamed protein product, partial [Mycena citricolor]
KRCLGIRCIHEDFLELVCKKRSALFGCVCLTQIRRAKAQLAYQQGHRSRPIVPASRQQRWIWVFRAQVRGRLGEHPKTCRSQHSNIVLEPNDVLKSICSV